MLRGVPISPGVAIARAYRLDPALARHKPQLLDVAALSSEVNRFDAACELVAAELEMRAQRVTAEIGREAGNVFESHRSLLRDPALVAKVKGTILTDHVDAITALNRTLEEYDVLFARIRDDYLRERVTDVRDVIEQVIERLAVDQDRQTIGASEPVVLIAAEIRPSQAAMFDRLPVSGIATEGGGATGHAAVLARGLGIPAVSGLAGLLDKTQNGDLVIIDGREGVAIVNPGPEVEAAYRKLQREYVDLRDGLAHNRDLISATTDGEEVELLVNANSAIDAAAGTAAGATGVGLFRTEFVFLTHPSVPTEEEQVSAYSQIVEAAPYRSVVIRTLDLGGDKQVSYFSHQREANPFMGFRSIRMSSEHPEFFQTQLRAILRAGASGSVSILFPMISTVEEVRRLRRLIDRARMALHSQRAAYGESVRFGVMIEVPAAAVCIDHILQEVDFVSVGTNDLIQYLMAADRDNPRVASLCDPCHPAIYRVLRHILSRCNARSKPVTICGEMAGRPTCMLPLIGLGLRRASMSPAFVPAVKELVRSISIADARKVARAVLRMETAEEVRTYLNERLRKLCPNVANIDTP